MHGIPTLRVAPRLFGNCGDGGPGSCGLGRVGLTGRNRNASEVAIESGILLVVSFLNTLFTLLALSVDVSLAVELDGVLSPKFSPNDLFIALPLRVEVSLAVVLDGVISPKFSPTDPLAFPFPFSAALDDPWFFDAMASLNAGTGGLPIDSRFSTALAAAAFPAAFRLVMDTVETLDLTEAEDVGRIAAGSNFFVSPFP